MVLGRVGFEQKRVVMRFYYPTDHEVMVCDPFSSFHVILDNIARSCAAYAMPVKAMAPKNKTFCCKNQTSFKPAWNLSQQNLELDAM